MRWIALNVPQFIGFEICSPGSRILRSQFFPCLQWPLCLPVSLSAMRQGRTLTSLEPILSCIFTALSTTTFQYRCKFLSSQNKGTKYSKKIRLNFILIKSETDSHEIQNGQRFIFLIFNEYNTQDLSDAKPCHWLWVNGHGLWVMGQIEVVKNVKAYTSLLSVFLQSDDGLLGVFLEILNTLQL